MPTIQVVAAPRIINNFGKATRRGIYEPMRTARPPDAFQIPIRDRFISAVNILRPPSAASILFLFYIE